MLIALVLAFSATFAAPLDFAMLDAALAVAPRDPEPPRVAVKPASLRRDARTARREASGPATGGPLPIVNIRVVPASSQAQSLPLADPRFPVYLDTYGRPFQWTAPNVGTLVAQAVPIVTIPRRGLFGFARQTRYVCTPQGCYAVP